MIKKLINAKSRISIARFLGLIPPYRKEFDENKTIFIHIPKAAGMSIVNSIYGVNSSNHYTYINFKNNNRLKFDNYFKFSFVRNPYDRCISAYSYLSQGGMNDIDKYWYNKYIKQYKDISDFIKNGLETAIKEQAEHFIPQCDFIYDGSDFVVDFLGKFESISEDMDRLSKIITMKKPLKIINKSNHVPHVLTFEDKEILYRLYKQDFELLGYEK